MIDATIAILTSIDFWKITAPALIAVLAWTLNERSKRNWERWQMRKAACLRALNIANALLSSYKYANVKDGDIVPQYESVKEVRACINELACTCDGPEVLDQMKRILFSPALSPDAIVDLRNAVRRELSFSTGVIDTDRDRAFVGRVVCEESKRT